ncbi:MAG TPA: hypothetical protein VHQ65_00930 [Thermoanaerobaculia bacterium]|nr:hypothetical protein [Thermoanaerobaculia bacterium]
MPRSASPPRASLILVLLALATGCATPQPLPPGAGAPPSAPAPPRAAAVPAPPLPAGGAADPAAAACPQVPPEYVAALAAARYPSPEKISRDLLPILRSTPGLQWDVDGRVLMVTWTLRSYYEQYASGQHFSLYGVTWLTAVPQAQDFCRAYRRQHPGEPLAPRIFQALGMPVGSADGQVFAELWISPARFFRPCPDPEITDHECQVEIPLAGVDTSPSAPGAPPWHCPELAEPTPRQVSGGWVEVTQAHLAWMCTWWRSSYDGAGPGCDFPWTALGYTYDWGDPTDPVGLSEYVAPAGTPAVFHRLATPEEYCGD